MRVIAACVILAIALCGCSRNAATAAGPLRVCSDPNNLPFSNRAGKGFENRIAELVAADLGTTVAYTWWAHRRGFLRETLYAGKCDVVMGLTAGMESARTTSPYYTSTYVFVTRASRAIRIQSFDDDVLRALRIGVQLIGDDGANSPPAHSLSRRGMVDNLVGYTVYGDYGTESPSAQIVRAVANGEVDVAAVWGPLAGYFAAHEREPLDIVPVQPRQDGPLPQAYDIAMAVRRDDEARLAQLESFLTRRKAEVNAILDAYHVPRVSDRRPEAPLVSIPPGAARRQVEPVAVRP